VLMCAWLHAVYAPYTHNTCAQKQLRQQQDKTEAHTHVTTSTTTSTTPAITTHIPPPTLMAIPLTTLPPLLRQVYNGSLPKGTAAPIISMCVSEVRIPPMADLPYVFESASVIEDISAWPYENKGACVGVEPTYALVWGNMTGFPQRMFLMCQPSPGSYAVSFSVPSLCVSVSRVLSLSLAFPPSISLSLSLSLSLFLLSLALSLSLYLSRSISLCLPLSLSLSLFFLSLPFALALCHSLSVVRLLCLSPGVSLLSLLVLEYVLPSLRLYMRMRLSWCFFVSFSVSPS